MFKSSGRSFGRKSTGTVTVIEDRVRRSSARNARLALFITLSVVWLLAATVAADRMHPILAALLGLGVGVVAGLAAWLIVRVWPVFRLLWWWTPEITLGLVLVYGWTALAHHTPWWLRLPALALLLGVPAFIPVLRRKVVALAWCAIVRHRLRTCFAQFIITNRTGSLPLILLARPTPVGERVWVYLRPGLSLAEMQTRLDKLAVACHADTVIVERASEATAAYLRIDIKRRDALKAMIGSPLVDLVDPNTPTPGRSTGDVPTALDLPDVTTHMPAQRHESNGRRPAAPGGVPAMAGATGDDDTDWI